MYEHDPLSEVSTIKVICIDPKSCDPVHIEWIPYGSPLGQQEDGRWLLSIAGRCLKPETLAAANVPLEYLVSAQAFAQNYFSASSGPG